MSEQKQKGLNISTRSFITAIVVIFVLMVASYILTLVVPGGAYARIPDENGNLIIDTASGFSPVEGGIPFWKGLLSPILVLGLPGMPPSWRSLPSCWSSEACSTVWTAAAS